LNQACNGDRISLKFDSSKDTITTHSDIFGRILLEDLVVKHFPACLLVTLFTMANGTALLDDDPVPSKKDKDAYAGVLTGKVTKRGKRNKDFTLRVEYYDLQPNSSYGGGSGQSGEIQSLIRQQQDLARLQADLMKTEKQSQKLAKLQHYSSKLNHGAMKTHAQHLPYKVVTRHESIDLQSASDVEVRTANPPPKFDDNGKAQKYTSSELRELKGPGKAWGFPADWSHVHKGQLITVFLSKRKTVDPEAKDGTVHTKASTDEGRIPVSKIHILTD
jgi:hypothetical protein